MGASSVSPIIWQNKECAGAHGPKVEATDTLRLATTSRGVNILPISYVFLEAAESTMHANVHQLYYTIGAGPHGLVAEKNTL